MQQNEASDQVPHCFLISPRKHVVGDRSTSARFSWRNKQNSYIFVLVEKPISVQLTDWLALPTLDHEIKG